MSVCLVGGVNVITILCVLEVIINMQREMNCMREDMEKGIYGIYKKIDESIAWMKANFTQGFKNSNTNLEVPASGEFYLLLFIYFSYF